MRKGYIFTIVILFLINVLLTLVLMRLKTNLSELQFLYFEVKEQLKLEKENKTNSLEYLSINNNQINELQLTDINNQTYSVKNILTDKKGVLIFRFHETACMPCIEKYLTRLKTCMETTNNENVIILASYTDIKKYKEEFLNFGIKTYFCNSDIFEFDKNRQAFLFTTGSGLITRNAYIPNELQLNNFEDYLIQVLSKIK